MDIKEVGKAMQSIEFVLFSVKNDDHLHPGEVERAHQLARKVMENYLLEKGAFEE
jgi:hypothetical protein